MSKQTDYKEDEWKLVMNAPMTAAAVVVAADFGLVSFAKEIKAAIRFIDEAKQSYADVGLIQVSPRRAPDNPGLNRRPLSPPAQ